MAEDSSKIWTVFSLVTAVGAAAFARKAIYASWKVATGKKPPENPADPDVQIGEAIAFAAISGALVGMARMLAQRRAAGYYARSAGHLPPGLKRDGE